MNFSLFHALVVAVSIVICRAACNRMALVATKVAPTARAYKQQGCAWSCRSGFSRERYSFWPNHCATATIATEVAPTGASGQFSVCCCWRLRMALRINAANRPSMPPRTKPTARMSFFFGLASTALKLVGLSMLYSMSVDTS